MDDCHGYFFARTHMCAHPPILEELQGDSPTQEQIPPSPALGQGRLLTLLPSVSSAQTRDNEQPQRTRTSHCVESEGLTAAEIRDTSSHQQVSGSGVGSVYQLRYVTSRTTDLAKRGQDHPLCSPHTQPARQHNSSLTSGSCVQPRGPQSPGRGSHIPWTLEQACFSMGLSIFLA